MKVSIVIPCFDHFKDCTSNILMDIFQNCQNIDEVVVVDDASKKEETFRGYDFWRSNLTTLGVVELKENVGFLKASNIGMKEATGDIIALISNDVRIKKDLRKIAREIFLARPNVLLGGRVLDYDTGWNTFDGRIYPYVEGWALIATKQAWKDFGYFDEQFAPHDFEDVDLSTTAISKGYQLSNFFPWHGEVLEHMVAQSIGYTDERRAITEAHRELFRKKWIKDKV